MTTVDAATPVTAAPPPPVASPRPVHAPRQQRLATVVVERPRCPSCNGTRLHKYRSITDQGDGSALAWVRCMAENCGCRFKLLLE